MNLQAWLKAGDLGLVPLLMAGDKESIYGAQKVRRREGLELAFHGVGNYYEDCLFKMGFSGVRVRSPMLFCNISLAQKLKFAGYYARAFMKTPAFINASLWDTFLGYLSLFFVPHDADEVCFYHFIPWDEAVIVNTLIEEYGWERPADTCLTWRIDDGTSAFYNYIYLTVAGFTENDTFRSYQVREGLMSRSEALKIVEAENRPRVETIAWYARTVGFDAEAALRVINGMDKLY